MAAEPICAECGAPLPGNAPGNRCPKCLLQLALEETGNHSESTKPPEKAGEACCPPGAASPDPGPVDEQIGTMIGRYRLLQQIGEGGFGVVFMAGQTEPVQRKVALKVIKAGMDTREIIARFEAERQALALMDHPNIARVLDGGTTASRRPYFVMELVRGIPITEYCDEAELSTRDRLELFIKVCRAVQHAHQKGVIHRDLKPGNVLVTLHDGEPVPKVIDFGVAKALGQKLTEKTLFTRFEQMIGTPAYMSPEQAALGGLDIDTRSDIYSLGVLLYELLTGVTPLDAGALRKGALDEIRRMIRETDPPTPSTRLRTMSDRVAEVARCRQTQPATLSRLIRGDLDWITMKCLEKDRQRRYETVNGLAIDLERHLHSEPVMARPPNKLYRVQKLVRRNKLSFGAAAITGVALLLATVISTWQAVRVTRARSQAIEEAAKQEAINGFLNGMLASADPYKVSANTQAKGRNVTVVDVLAAAARQLDNGSLKDRPAIEAAIRLTMGRTFLGLGQGRAAEAQLVRALELNQRVHGNQSDEAAECVFNLAAMRSETGKPGAESLAREALKLELRLHGHEHKHVARTLVLLATIFDADARGAWGGLRNEKSISGAENTYREALAIERSLHDPDSLVLSEILGGLAGVLTVFRHNQVEAEALLREALQLQKATFGPTNLMVASSLDRLAYVLDSRQKHTEAENCCEEAVAIMRDLLGPTNSPLSSALGTLGIVRLNQQQFAAAEAAFRECLAIRRQIMPGGPDAAWSLQMLAQALMAQKKFGEAESLYREELQFWESRGPRGVASETYWEQVQVLLRLLKDENKPEEIEATSRQILERQGALLGQTNVVVLAMQCQLADFLASANRTAEAAQLYKSASAGIANLGPGRNLAAARYLANSLQSHNPPGEAERLYRILIRIEEQNPDQPNFYLAELRLNFGDLLCAQTNFAAAAEEYGKMLPARRLSPDDKLLWTLQQLARALVAASRPKEAETYLREAVPLYWKLHQPGDADATAWAQKTLGDVLVQQGKWDDAEREYRDALAAFSTVNGLAHDGFAETVESLVELLKSQKKMDEAKSVLDRTMDAGFRQNSTEPRVKGALQRLVRLYQGIGRADLKVTWEKRLQRSSQTNEAPASVRVVAGPK